MPDFNYSAIINDLNDKIASGPPKVDFSILGDLPKTYYEGRKSAQEDALRNAFQNGVPLDKATGQPDFAEMAKVLFQRGGLNEGVAASNLDLQRQRLKYATDTDAAVSGQPAQPIVGPSTSRNSVTIDPSKRADIGTSAAAPQPQEPKPTVMGILSASGIPNDQLGAASASVARQLGVNPTDPINKDDPQVRNVLVPAIQQLKRAGIGQVVQEAPQGVPQPQQVAQAVPQQQQPMAAPQAAPPQGSQPASFDQRFTGLVPPGRSPEQQLMLLRRAIGSGLLPPEVAKAYQAQAEAIQKAFEPTPEEKAFLASKRTPGLDDYTAGKTADTKRAEAVAAADVKEQQG
ncbi:MAG TPA: hypothetical protein VGR76_07145, partial [Candidatus Angelobacter sp.]|nr:hypothetical protein [Candidatus Angelobacter sp.]